MEFTEFLQQVEALDRARVSELYRAWAALGLGLYSVQANGQDALKFEDAAAADAARGGSLTDPTKLAALAGC